jgi:hypothetical protein
MKMRTITFDENDIYSKFKALEELTKLMKVTPEGSLITYSKLIQTSELTEVVCDYGVGFLNVEIYVMQARESMCKEKFCVRIWFATIDDGDFGGWSIPMEKEEAITLAKRIAEGVFEYMVKFPNLQTLNEMLMPYGMVVGYE